MAQFSDLVGKTLTAIEKSDEEIVFSTADTAYKMEHFQDCCENVYVDEIHGVLDDLIGSPILLAEEAKEENKNASESGTWTFYKLATVKGHVTIRWNGESNGYYSESVSFHELKR